MPHHKSLPILLVVCLIISLAARSQAADPAKLRRLDATVIPADSDRAKELPRMLSYHARARRQAANLRESKLWRKVQNKADWEKYRDQRLNALRDSLGQYPAPPKDLKVTVTKTIKGDGYQIENIVFASRPNCVVTANLYSPIKPGKSMPGILIQHSHHRPKTEGELQDMGMIWARAGCVVLVMDSLGHGERRAHPFKNASSYPEKYRVSRQDYYFRYNTSLQLYAVGDSLMGWMVYDLMRGVDLLLSRPGIDPKRIIVLGAVAGGGDPAAVVAALDQRIKCLVPFNFGGPQPENVFPLPKDAEDRFNYSGGGSWESTRNLHLSIRNGFFPWVIVAGAAPNPIIHAHEFAWDQQRDPVWRRYQKIYGFYGQPGHLTFSKGSGSVKGRPPESTHCNNIGQVHRKSIHPAFQKWFGIPLPEEKFRDRKPSAELLCMTPDVQKVYQPKQLHELAAQVGEARVKAARKRRASLPANEQRKKLQSEWAGILGNVEPRQDPKVLTRRTQPTDTVNVERILLEVEPNVVVPTVLLLPKAKTDRPFPVVVAFAQAGKAMFLQRRSDDIAALLKKGTAVCLPDLRGTGETSPGTNRARRSSSTSISALELMMGQPLVGSRLRDLRSVIRYLRGRKDVNGSRLALWGDSFAKVNPPDGRVAVPLDLDLPDQAEPLGGLLAILGALFEPEVRAVYARGGLSGYDALLHSQFVYVPHDSVVPGALTTGDLVDVVTALAPRPVRLEGMIDGLNRRVPTTKLLKAYQLARDAYRSTGAADRLVLQPGKQAGTPGEWLTAQLGKKR